jgi:MoxR-like ATPase
MSHDCPVEARTLDSLRLAERFVVWAVREWRLRWRDGEARPETLRRGFHHADVGDGLTPFCDFMDALVAATRRPLDVRCMNCAYVSPYEDLVLDAVAAVQRDRDEVAYALLMDVLPRAATRLATGHLAAFAHKMAESGLVLPRGPSLAADHISICRSTNPGIALVQ